MTENNSRRFPAWATLALVSFSVFLGALDLTVVSTILRQVIFDLEIPFPSGLNEAAWIVTGYLLAYTLTMPFMGRFSDLYGRRNVYWMCMALFILGSAIVGLANSLPMMIAGRVLQALGAGALVPVSMAVVGDIFPEVQRPIALGIIGAVDTAGWVFGPLYGAWMVTQFEWRWIFFINLPLGILGAIFAWGALRHLDRPNTVARMDYPGAVLLSIALAALNLALTGSSNAGTESSFSTASATSGGGLSSSAPYLMLVCVIAFILFLVRERRTDSPLINLGMFRNGTFSAACAVNWLIGGALIAAVVDVPLFVNTVMLLSRNWSPAQADWQSGVILAVLTSGMVVASLLGGFLTEWLGYRVPTLLGLVIATVGFGLMSRWSPTLDDWTQVRDLAICGGGLGMVISPIATAVINTVQDDQRGTASALVLILRLVGMTIALSGLTTWGVYRFDELTRKASLADMTGAFVSQISAQVMSEIFIMAAGLCLIGILPALWLRRVCAQIVHAVHSWW